MPPPPVRWVPYGFWGRGGSEGIRRRIRSALRRFHPSPGAPGRPVERPVGRWTAVRGTGVGPGSCLCAAAPPSRYTAVERG
ncbi:hypothetical protein SCA03_67160 [Streptomyces cacaoi]|uniref:Uncharacterized protein n=1 Tax=Streptomyces cacaoi TaxID=1898 RepID=A0A4Y3R8U6_STRCI|nr:hypothetical protein SCA03_67160 [Streptomyces cacaoi]